MRLRFRLTAAVALAGAGIIPAVAVTAGTAPAAAAHTAAAGGTRLWLAQFSGGTTRSGSATALAVNLVKPIVYVTGSTVRNNRGHDSTVAYNAATGTRRWVATNGFISGHHQDGRPGIAVSPDGSTVYVEDNTGFYNYAATYIHAYDAITGAPLWTARLATISGWGGARFLTISPDGSQLFIAGNSGIDFTSFTVVGVNSASGQQNWQASTPGQSDHGAGPTSLAVSPNGSAVFMTGLTGTYAFNAATGAQLWRDHYKLRWRRTPGYLAVSPDSATVFVASASSEGVATKPHDITTACNAATGAQLWVTRYDGGGLAGVAVSPDGSRVFVTGSGHLGFETIAYDASTGARVWAEHGVGTGGASSIVASGSGVFVTGAATGSGGLNEYATVAYDASTGAQLWGARYQGPPGASSSPAALGVSADGSAVFVTGTTALASTHREFATIAYQAG